MSTFLQSSIKSMNLNVLDLTGKISVMRVDTRSFNEYKAKYLTLDWDLSPVTTMKRPDTASQFPQYDFYSVKDFDDLSVVHQNANLYRLIPMKATTLRTHLAMRAMCCEAGSPFQYMQHSRVQSLLRVPAFSPHLRPKAERQLETLGFTPNKFGALHGTLFSGAMTSPDVSALFHSIDQLNEYELKRTLCRAELVRLYLADNQLRTVWKGWPQALDFWDEFFLTASGKSKKKIIHVMVSDMFPKPEEAEGVSRICVDGSVVLYVRRNRDYLGYHKMN